VSFLQWTFLLGAVAVVGPIVAHMLAKPRFRRVPFTMLQFLRTGQQESYSRRKLRDLLVLLLRCAILVLMAVLFARPVLHVTAEPPRQRSIHYLALDDSMSMMYKDGGRSLFERMTEAAVDHVGRAPDGTSFSICGLASGRTVHGLTRSQALAEVKRLTAVPKSARLIDYLSILKQAARTGAPGDTLSAVVISDFTPGVLRQLERIHEPAAVHEWKHEVIVPAAPVNNAAITEARAINVSDDKLDIDVAIANYGDTRQQREITLRAPDLKPVSAAAVLQPHERLIVRMQMDLGLSAHRSNPAGLPVEATLSPKDNLVEDDVYRLAVYIPHAASTNVLIVDRAEETFLFETAMQALAQEGPAKGLTLKKVKESRLAAADLDWADTVVFSSVPAEFSCPTSAFQNHLAGGGKLIFFATQVDNRQTAERLLREGLLAAVPEKWVQGTTYPEPQPLTGEYNASSNQTTRMEAQDFAPLRNYRLDRIAFKGYWQCRVPADAACVWRLANGSGFLYYRPSHGGVCILVNTSIDDSLGPLAKSRAWVAFCSVLAGEAEQVRQFCFCPEDRPILNLPNSSRITQQASLGIENCDGGKTQAAREGTRILLPPPKGIGWMRTLGEPTLYAAINLPAGETDLGRPTERRVADAMSGAFAVNTSEERVLSQAGGHAESRVPPVRDKPVWKAFAWATILLLLVEPAITNRLKR